MGQADNIRRAISKKKMQIIEEERKVFVYGDPEKNIPGCVGNGVSEVAAQAIYKEILDFANYAFNKAHAVCYAKVAYDTAYLKCHYPKEYMAALLSSVLDNTAKTAGYPVCGIYDRFEKRGDYVKEKADVYVEDYREALAKRDLVW